MHILHDIGSDDCMEISFHKIKHKIDIFVIFCFEDIEKGYDIGMSIEFLEKNNLDRRKGTSL